MTWAHVRREHMNVSTRFDVDAGVEAAALDQTVLVLAVGKWVVAFGDDWKPWENHESAIWNVGAKKARLIIVNYVEKAGFSCIWDDRFPDVGVDSSERLN